MRWVGVLDGDAWSLEEAEMIRKTTGVRGVMSGRGLLSNPVSSNIILTNLLSLIMILRRHYSPDTRQHQQKLYRYAQLRLFKSQLILTWHHLRTSSA